MTWLNLHRRTDNKVKVYVAPGCKEDRNRIELSSGTRLVSPGESSELVNGVSYEEGAGLPREPWRAPTGEEADSLIATELPRDMAVSVALVKLPGEFTNDAREAIRNISDETLEVLLLQPLRTICALGEPLHYIGPVVNPANLTTVTINHHIGRYNGLHVDLWDQSGLSSRHRASNRICLNIGKEPRYLMFLPLSLMDIAATVSREMGPNWQMPKRYTVIGREFMKRFPDMPAVRCRIAPGEAYIAPTENLVHDGSSIGQTHADEQFTIRGHIRPL